jgi:hypothetical protein
LLLELDLPFISSVTVVYAPSVVIDISVPFIGSATVVYAPTLQRTYVEAPFIGSVTVVYTPSLQRTYIDAPFIPSVTFVYPPTLKIAFTGGGVSQVALEVLTSDGEPNAQVSQVTLEIIVPMYKGLHVWQRS